MDIVAQSVSDAEADMNRVQLAADAISDAISRVRPWLTPETWDGAAATSWGDDWVSFYQGVQSCLNDLPAAESSIISAVETQMIQIEAQRRRQASGA